MIEQDLQNVMIKKGVTLASGESCTGGSIAAAITSLPGASEYFLGSIVTYADALKKEILGVKSIESCGAVSEEVVREMAAGILTITHASYAIAVTGIAGPSGGTEKKPVGMVWCAIASSKGEMWTSLLPKIEAPQRETIIDSTKNYILENLWRYLEHGTVPFE